MARFFTSLLLLFVTSNFCFGQLYFQRTYSGFNSGNIDHANNLRQTSDGGFIMIGSTGATTATNDMLLIKTSSNGAFQWARTFGVVGEDEGEDVIQTFDGGYAIVGFSDTNNIGSRRAVLIKTNSSGVIQWIKKIGSIGEEAYSIKQTTDSGFVVGGFTGTGLPGMYMVKTNSSGTIQWSKAFGFNMNSNEAGREVEQTLDGGYILVGFMYDFNNGQYYVYLVKTDASGNLQWSKTFDAPGIGYFEGFSVQQSPDLGFIVAGFTDKVGAGQEDVLVIKTDQNGTAQWAKTYGGAGVERGTRVKNAAGGGFVISGYTSSFGFGSEDYYLIKTDNSGIVVWSKVYGGSQYDDCFGVLQTADSGFVMAGYTQGFNTQIDYFLVKTAANGNIGCNSMNVSTITNSITVFDGGFPTVSNNGTTISHPSTMPSVAGGISATVCTNVGVQEIGMNEEPLIYPNPNQGQFTISGSGDLSIFNVLGEKVYSTKMTTINSQVDLSTSPKGIYFYQIISRDRTIGSGKIIIQ